MNIRNSLFASSVSAALLLAAAPALAQSISAGATVSGPQGAEVGTITSVDGDFVVLRTDRHEVRLPAASFTATNDGVLFGMTRDQVNSQVDAMLAQADQVITVGALVRDSEGALVGPIHEVAPDAVIVRVDQNLVRLPKGAVAPGPNGPVVGVTVAEIRAQTAAAAPAPAPAEESAGAATETVDSAE